MKLNMWNSYDIYENWGLIILLLLLPMAIDISFLPERSCKYIAMFAANDQLYSYTYWEGSNILQCLQRRTKYITIFTAKVQLYSNTYWKEPNIVQCLHQRTKYITIFKTKDHAIIF